MNFKNVKLKNMEKHITNKKKIIKKKKEHSYTEFWNKYELKENS